MTDDLLSRCQDEVERAMADEPHDGDCLSRVPMEPCDCTYGGRLAARLARMLAAGIGAAGQADWREEPDARLGYRMCALRAVARAREAP